MAPEFYNQLGAMHGTIMVVMGRGPAGGGRFGNFVVPRRSARRTWRSRA